MLAPAWTRRVARVWRAWWVVWPGIRMVSDSIQVLNATANVDADRERCKLGLLTRLGNNAIVRRWAAVGSVPCLSW